MNRVSAISDEKWFDMLLKSIESRVVDGIKFPGFPDDSVQSQFVGSSNKNALTEGFQFYKLVKGYAQALGMPIEQNSKFLDFGCGWGRYLRFFWKDVDECNLFGVDIDPDILEECRENGVPGQLDRIYPDGNLPFPDNHFSSIIAYSVFTHLPENIHVHWMREIVRVAKHGCVFVLTLESIKFLNFVESLDSENPISGWHAGLSHFSSDIPSLRKLYDDGKFVYLPTGGGDFRAADVYGDAVVSRKYVEEVWSKDFNIIDYIEDPERFWQTVLIVQRH